MLGLEAKWKRLTADTACLLLHAVPPDNLACDCRHHQEGSMSSRSTSPPTPSVPVPSGSSLFTLQKESICRTNQLIRSLAGIPDYQFPNKMKPKHLFARPTHPHRMPPLSHSCGSIWQSGCLSTSASGRSHILCIRSKDRTLIPILGGDFNGSEATCVKR